MIGRVMSLLVVTVPSLVTAFTDDPLEQAALTPNAHVAQLNRMTFTGNVIAYQEDMSPDNWIVMFCAPWFAPCHALRETWLALAATHGLDSSPGDDPFAARRTRFAEVDCAVDKVLCNSQDVDMYPTVVRYRKGGRSGEWSFSNRDLEKESTALQKWMGKELDKALAADEAEKAAREEGISVVSPEPAATGADQRPVSMADFTPMVLAMAAGAMYVGRLGGEMLEGIELIRTRPGVPLAVQEKKPDAASAALAGVATVRSLPEAWVTEKGILEL